ncbi:MAG: UDP-N-acetylglucosamine 4,6-dehydratase family protein, partial [Oceanococcaceae bacterium]
AVLVTGAGGSIGSELARQVLHQSPRLLVLLDHSEHNLYQIERELLSTPAADRIRIVPVLGSVYDRELLDVVFAQHDIETVYHAAAYKHVPLVEANMVSGVRNNVTGSWVAASAAARAGVESFVLVSTDKAVRPTNVMGATKRLAELGVQALAKVHSRTRFSIVRFGNVLNSSGSVVPLFREQIARGGPVTVTHRDVIRYFMTIPEAAQLVIQAGAQGKKAEVFVLDMGPPVRILELAQKMIRLAGKSPRLHGEKAAANEIRIELAGLRPGEKLFEELLVHGSEAPTRHPRIMQADEPSVSLAEYEEWLSRINACMKAHDLQAMRVLLMELPLQYAAAAIQEKLPSRHAVSRVPVSRQL